MCFTLPYTSGLCFDPVACFLDEFQKMWLNQMRLSEREDEKSARTHTHTNQYIKLNVSKEGLQKIELVGLSKLRGNQASNDQT